MQTLPDGSAFFVAEVPLERPRNLCPIPGQHEAVMWNPFNKVVQDHRDGTINMRLTNAFRLFAGLPIPWTPEIGSREVHEAPIFQHPNIPPAADAAKPL